MEKIEITMDELNSLPQSALVLLYSQLVQSFNVLIEQNNTISMQNKELLSEVSNLRESVAVLTQQRFGRNTEKSKDMLDNQLSFDESGNIFLNDSEYILDTSEEESKSDEELFNEFLKRKNARKRKQGKREDLLKDLEIVTERHDLTVEELNETFPDGYRQLDDDISFSLKYIPAKFVATEHHTAVYVSSDGSRFARGNTPKKLLAHSIITPELAAAIINAKYVNGMPINRITEEFKRNDVEVSRQTMARWMISISDRYFNPIIKHMHKRLLEADLIHADETPFIVAEDRKIKGSKSSKSYMWVYHTASEYNSPPIFIYDYRDNRRTESVEDYLTGYRGVLMADGYEAYHKLEKESNGEITVAGCWAHCKRKFAEIIKAAPKKTEGTIAYEGNRRIAAIYHVDNMAKGLTSDERLSHRMANVLPLVDSFFDWAKSVDGKIGTKKTSDAITYAINQEKYLRQFLNNGIIPLDNSDAERSIRSFCVGKHSWHVIATKRGAKSSADLYSIAETAKANKVKTYDYFKYVLEKMLENEGNITDEFLESIMPWSEEIPEEVRKKK